MIWGLAVIVLGVGLGAWLVLRTRGDVDVTSAADPRQRQIELQDERNRLLERLRDEDLTEGDRAELELAAARVLREIEGLDGLASEVKTEVTTSERGSDPAAATGRRSTWVGFAWGVGASLAIVALVLLAGRDSRSRQMGEPITGGDGLRPGAEIPADFEHPGTEVPPEVQAQLDDLERRWTEEQDLAALKELTLANLSLQRFMQAHQWSQVILERDPEDPDGLYSQGVVRMAMGQSDTAVRYFDRVLAAYPNHLLALVAKGAAYRGLGQTDAARATWEQALLVSGNQPQIQQLLADLDQPTTPGLGQATPPTAATSTDAASSYRIDLTCAGTRPAADTLFVILRSAGGQAGPPIAVQRLDRPELPAIATLTLAESMMGGALPDSGTVTVRWDADGNAMTREDLPEIAVEAAIGEAISLEICP